MQVFIKTSATGNTVFTPKNPTPYKYVNWENMSKKDRVAFNPFNKAKKHYLSFEKVDEENNLAYFHYQPIGAKGFNKFLKEFKVHSVFG